MILPGSRPKDPGPAARPRDPRRRWGHTYPQPLGVLRQAHGGGWPLRGHSPARAAPGPTLNRAEVRSGTGRLPPQLGFPARHPRASGPTHAPCPEHPSGGARLGVCVYPQREPACAGSRDGEFAPSMQADPTRVAQPGPVFGRPQPRSALSRRAPSARSPAGGRAAGRGAGARAGAAAGARARPGQRRGRSARPPLARPTDRERTAAARGNWEATPCLRSREAPAGSREAPSAPRHSPPVCRGPRRRSARAAGTPGRGGGRSPDALRSRGGAPSAGAGVRELERPPRSERRVLSPAATQPWSRP